MSGPIGEIPGAPPGGEGYQGPIPPSIEGGPPRTLKLLIAVVVIALLGVVAFALLRGGSDEPDAPTPVPSIVRATPTSRSPTPSASPTPTPTEPRGRRALTGTMALPAVSRSEPCPKDIPLTIVALDGSGETLDTSRLVLAPRGDACVGSFEMEVVTGTVITFGLRLGAVQTDSMITGPTFTAEQLEQRDYDVRLDLMSFEPQTPEGDGNRTLAPALKAAMKYYEDNDESFIGLDAAMMQELVPDLTFNDADEVVTGEVSVREVKKDTILFVIELEDGVPYCRGIDPPIDGSYGFADLQTYRECLEWQGDYPGDVPQVL